MGWESTLLGYVLLFSSSALSASAGVGGGSTNVAIFMSVFGYDFRTASALSLCTLMGNYLLQVAINIDKEHPLVAHRSIIYWEAVLVLLPSELGGSNLGVILADMVPDTILYMLAVVVCVFALLMSLRKAFQYYDMEVIEAATNERVQLISPPPSTYGATEDVPTVTCMHTGGNMSDDEKGFMDDECDEADDDEQEVQSVRRQSGNGTYSLTRFCKDNLCGFIFGSSSEDEPKIHYPWLIIAVLVGSWVLYCTIYVIMKMFPLCSENYNVSLAALCCLLVVEISWGLWYVLSNQAEGIYRKSSSNTLVSDDEGFDDDHNSNSGHVNNSSFERRGSPATATNESEQALAYLGKGDINWKKGCNPAMPVLSFTVGVLSSLLGFGGGELLAPVLLYMKVCFAG